MKIATTYKDGQILQHFGHSEEFKIYDIEDNQIVSSEIVPTNGKGYGALADFLKNQQVSILICGNIGNNAKTALAEAKIKLFGGVTGKADVKVKALISGNLIYNPNAQCIYNNHGQKNGHNCGGYCNERSSDNNSNIGKKNSSKC